MKELDKSTLEITSIYTTSGIYPRENKVDSYMDFIVEWNCNLGFGAYTISINSNGKVTGYSEFMDSNEDKSFLKALLEKIADSINIAE